MSDQPLINQVEVAAYRIPTQTPEADGTLAWDATEMLLVKVHAGGCIGLGYSYTAAQAAGNLVQTKLHPLLMDADPLDIPRVWQTMNDALRNIGRPGLGLMAISAVDSALWDLKAKILGVSLYQLLGKARQSVPLYGSGGFTSYDDRQLREQLSGWLEQGMKAVKIKLGCGLAEDKRRVQCARDVIGREAELMVDANGAYQPREALALAEELGEAGASWLEEPVSSDDLEGLVWVRQRAPAGLAIAAGEYGWDLDYFRKMLSAGAVDVLQADATRCGYSGFWQAAQVCEAFQRPLSAHCAPAVHAALCAAAPRFCHLEYFYDHARIEAQIFSGLPELRDGALWPEDGISGHGLHLREKAAEAYRI